MRRPRTPNPALDPNRRELQAVRRKFDAVPRLYVERFQAVSRARSAGMTWQEAADILGMTQHGLIQAQQTQARTDEPDTDTTTSGESQV